MKRLFLLSMTIGLVLACKKETTTPNSPSSPAEPNSSKATVMFNPGSYWIYELYLIDSNNVHTALGQFDTIRALGDTVIHGDLFTVFQRHLGNSGSTQHMEYLRDSSGYIVNHGGVIKYSYVNFTDTLGTAQTGEMSGYAIMVDKRNQSLSVPAGNFNTVEMQHRWRQDNGDPFNQCGDSTYVVYSNYTENEGMIIDCRTFISDLQQCQRRELQLIEYFIAP